MSCLSSYSPKRASRMRQVGNTAHARQSYFKKRFRNLEFLLRKRYEWMRPYLEGKKTAIEFGSGTGLIKEFIPNVRLSDLKPQPWIDEIIDAENLQLPDESLDAAICCRMIHHLASPSRFFDSLSKKLSPGGMILIQEIHTSPLMKVILFCMRHESWDENRDIFDRTVQLSDPKQPWSGNCATANLLFRQKDRFESEFPHLEIVHNKLTEVFIFPLSGGVTGRIPMFELPSFLLNLVNTTDQWLINTAPELFAMGREVALKKRQ